MAGNNISNEDIEEIMFDSFFILWKNRNIFDKNKDLKPYLVGIVRNSVKLKYRKLCFYSDFGDYENKIIDFRAIDLVYEEREKISIIEKTLNKMKEQDIIIFNLYYYSSMKISNIAKQLNVSEFNIKSRLYRIRKKLKKELEKGGDSYEE